MEQITKLGGRYYYGNVECDGIEEAYSRIREDYHRSLGRRAFLRLDRLGQRRERLHGFGFHQLAGYEIPGEYKCRRVPYYILGMLGISYVRIVGLWDLPDMPEEELEKYVEALFTRGSGMLSLRSRKGKAGRMDKRQKNKYR